MPNLRPAPVQDLSPYVPRCHQGGNAQGFLLEESRRPPGGCHGPRGDTAGWDTGPEPRDMGTAPMGGHGAGGTWGQGRAHGWTHGTTAEEKLGQSRAQRSLSLRVIIGLIKKQLIIILAH